MTPEMAAQQALLTRLVEECYACREVSLKPISPYQLEERGIYQVTWGDGTSSVLRAFLGDVAGELTGHAIVLDYLQRCGFVAPQVKRASDGAVLASHQGWTALTVSFVEGDVAEFDLDSLIALAECTGRLHVFSRNMLMATGMDHLPDSRLRPTQPATEAIDNLTQALLRVPEALRCFGEDSLVILQRVQRAQQAGLLPETLIHGDVWPGNAVRTLSDEIVLIDWDGAGIGPAILDLAYLLLACHLGQSQLPAIQPDEQRIAAVIQGYCRQRRPSAAELDVLEDALRYDVARRVGLEKLLSRLTDDWTEETWLQKMLVRYRAAPKIAVIARRYFQREAL